VHVAKEELVLLTFGIATLLSNGAAKCAPLKANIE